MKLCYKQDNKLRIVEIGENTMSTEEAINFVKQEMGLKEKQAVVAIVYEKPTEADMFTLKGNK